MAVFGSNQLVTKRVDKFWAVKWKKIFFQRVFQKYQNFEKNQNFFWPSKNAKKHILRLFCAVHFFLFGPLFLAQKAHISEMRAEIEKVSVAWAL